MTTATKAINEQLRQLYRQRRAWRLETPGLHHDQALVCHQHHTPDPDCESCGVTQMRADRAAVLDTEIRKITGKPEPVAKPNRKPRTKPVHSNGQTALFT